MGSNLGNTVENLLGTRLKIRSSGELRVHLLSPCVLLMNGLAFSLLFSLSTLLLVLSHMLLLLGLSYHNCLYGFLSS